MNVSGIIIVLIVFSGLFTYCIVPFQSATNLIDQSKRQLTFGMVFKEVFLRMIFHKKAVIAFILVVFTLYITWLGYDAAEDHINSHSGYPPISVNMNAYFMMFTVLLYSIILTLLLVLIKTFRVFKNVKAK
ncbi:TRAP-type C4-dicarboxylate transport system permease small subunit [Cytobacillus eiseniae]|uniref:TRAP-type C4-dicarboxylate transport system permease small subunit n=1 Tax=Cytobacillus eiseniae TaxID=762947 RepID=A0ABS4R9E5_9BACI|nr:TRAP-type C4-dicarboxylate transport system permease small subunit [Cytobacillus eiseniae]